MKQSTSFEFTAKTFKTKLVLLWAEPADSKIQPIRLKWKKTGANIFIFISYLPTPGRGFSGNEKCRK